MCAILGLYDPSGLAPESPAFSAALERMRSRGPDDSGSWQDSTMRFGHRRLAVVDLSPAGHQPMESSDHRFVIVFNGEIYNHLELRERLAPRGGWRGHSDTETLLEAYRAYGAGCLEHLNGMFAFAIWDRTERSLFLARDRMGVKPLYYTQRDGALAFASRPGALSTLLNEGRLEVDEQALRMYLELGYVPAPLSFQRGLRKLPPAHYLIANEHGVRCVRYWDFRPLPIDTGADLRTEEDLIDELSELIQSAVRVRLLSDVPLGAFLSGGVDSALVVAAMKSAGVEHPKAFTIGFEEKSFDESASAAATAQHLGVEHICETLGVNDLLKLLPDYIREYDEPFADSSAFPTMALARLARRHVTVALSGDGADELFGGYHYYPLIERMEPLTRLPAALRHAAARLLRVLPAHRAKLLAGALQSTDTAALFHYLRGTGKDHLPLLTTDVMTSTDSSESWFAQFAAGFAMNVSGVDSAMRLDAGITLPDLFLQKVDVATMAFSLEARCPMTDYRLVEWAMRLPSQYKVRNGQTKYLLKKALARHLPASQVYRPKMGFGVPIAQWLRGPLRSWAQELVHDDSLLSQLPLNRARLQQLLSEQQSGRRESHPLLWSALMLLCFLREHGSRRVLPGSAYRQVA